MKYRVTLLPQAEADVREIVDWIFQRSPSGAERWMQRWLEALDNLESTPESSGLAPEDIYHDYDIRQILFKTKRGNRYRAIFRVQDDEIFVYRVRGSGQDIVSPDDLISPDASEN